jgi:hypothetical protein
MNPARTFTTTKLAVDDLQKRDNFTRRQRAAHRLSSLAAAGVRPGRRRRMPADASGDPRLP